MFEFESASLKDDACEFSLQIRLSLALINATTNAKHLAAGTKSSDISEQTPALQFRIIDKS